MFCSRFGVDCDGFNPMGVVDFFRGARCSAGAAPIGGFQFGQLSNWDLVVGVAPLSSLCPLIIDT